MKKYMIQLVILAITVTLASCNWNPTDHGDGSDSDTTMVDITEQDELRVDIHEDEIFTTNKMKVIRIVSVESSWASQQVVQISVVNLQTGIEQIITLSMESPIVVADGCTFELQYIRPMPGLPGDTLKYIIGLIIS